MQLQWLPRPSAHGGWNTEENRHERDKDCSYDGFDRFGDIRISVESRYSGHPYLSIVWMPTDLYHLAPDYGKLDYDEQEKKYGREERKDAMILAESLIKEEE